MARNIHELTGENQFTLNQIRLRRRLFRVYKIHHFDLRVWGSNQIARISFYQAQKAFLDPKPIFAEDIEHSQIGKRYYCFGKVDDTIITVRFTYRGSTIRSIGAGYWRKGKKNLCAKKQLNIQMNL